MLFRSMRDLDQVKAVEVTLDERLYRLRTELRGHAAAAFAAAGVRPPPAVELIRDRQPAVADEMALGSAENNLCALNPSESGRSLEQTVEDESEDPVDLRLLPARRPCGHLKHERRELDD